MVIRRCRQVPLSVANGYETNLCSMQASAASGDSVFVMSLSTSYAVLVFNARAARFVVRDVTLYAVLLFNAGAAQFRMHSTTLFLVGRQPTHQFVKGPKKIERLT